jgi:hypothetical protein
MYSNLINKARNLTVEIHRRSGPKFAGRILDVDEVFIEVEVRLDKGGNLIPDRAGYDQAGPDAPRDRVLVNIADVGLIS